MNAITHNESSVHLARNAALGMLQRALIKVDETSIAYEKALRHHVEHGVFSGIVLARAEYWNACVEAEQAGDIYMQFSGAEYAGH